MEEEKEMLILSTLRQNSRASLTDISKQTKIPVSTIYDKLKSYNGGIVKKFTSILDFQDIGYGAKAFLLIKVSKERSEELKDHLTKNKSVNNLLKINNGYNFLVEVIFKTIPELENYVEKLESEFNLVEKQVFYIINDIKREDFLSSPEYQKLVNI
jgi:DNA-binding Lrp family transcriptional regulator